MQCAAVMCDVCLDVSPHFLPNSHANDTARSNLTPPPLVPRCPTVSDARDDVTPSIACDSGAGGTGACLLVWVAVNATTGSSALQWSWSGNPAGGSGTWAEPVDVVSTPTALPSAVQDLNPVAVLDPVAGLWSVVWSTRGRFAGVPGTARHVAAAQLGLADLLANGTASVWSAPVMLSANSSGAAVSNISPAAAVSGSEAAWVAAWVTTDPAATPKGLGVVRAVCGPAWTTCTVDALAGAANASSDLNPVVSFASDCMVMVAWDTDDDTDTVFAGNSLADRDLAAVASDDAGATWTDPFLLNPTVVGPSDGLGDDETGAVLAGSGGGVWILAYAAAGSGFGADPDVFAAATNATSTAGHPFPGPVCGNGVVECGEACEPGLSDGLGCCTASCQWAAPDTVCRAAAFQCDADEHCTGVSPNCPPDDLASNATACDDGTDCTHTDRCDGAGGCGGTPYACAPGQCETSSTCDGAGACLVVPAADGLACLHANASADGCQQAECLAGECALKAPVVCAPTSECEVASVCDGAGGCNVTLAADGIACTETDDGSTCTAETCQAGACVSGPAYDCLALVGPCQESAICDGLGGCTLTNKTDGTGCEDDPSACAVATCQAGVCVATPYTCEPAGPCEASTACGGNAGCAATASPDGTACDATANGTAPCTAGQCSGGVCAGAPYTCPPVPACRVSLGCDGNDGCLTGPAADGGACDDGDGDPCTSGACAGGVCAPGPATDCSSLVGACQVSAVCDGLGGCVVTNKTDGTSCETDPLACAVSTCQDGVCLVEPYTCAPGVCETSSACSGNAGCDVELEDDGTACDATANGTLPCRTGICGNGACVGVAYTCPPAGQCETAVACQGNDGCLAEPADDGTACDDGDGDACTLGACDAGSCQPGAPLDCSALATGLCEDRFECDGGGACVAVNKTDGVCWQLCVCVCVCVRACVCNA